MSAKRTASGGSWWVWFIGGQGGGEWIGGFGIEGDPAGDSWAMVTVFHPDYCDAHVPAWRVSSTRKSGPPSP